jgi:hypothetical protein
MLLGEDEEKRSMQQPMDNTDGESGLKDCLLL